MERSSKWRIVNSPNKSCGCSNQAKQALLLSIPIPPLIIYSILSLAPLPPTATTQQTTKITVPMVVVGNPGLTTQQAIQITVPIIVVILLLVVAIVITAVIIVYMKYRCVCVCVCLHVCVRACVCDVELLQPQWPEVGTAWEWCWVVQFYSERLYLWEKGYAICLSWFHSLCETQTTISVVCRICWSPGPLLLDRIVHKFVIKFWWHQIMRFALQFRQWMLLDSLSSSPSFCGLIH